MVESVVQQQQQSNGSNGNVTAIAVLQFIFGGVIILFGLLLAILGGSISSIVGQQFSQFGGETWGTLGAVMFIVIGLTMALFGVPSIIAATGLIRYKEWGRIFTLVMATIAGISAVFSIIDLDLMGALLTGGFCAYAWAMLTRPHIIALFRQQAAQQQTIVVDAA